MSLKQEIETWVQALGHYDNNEFEEAIRVFDTITDTSKIWFNCGVIHATIGEHDRAVQCYQQAVSLDQYLAVAYFQQGVSNFLVGDFEEALANFNDTLLYLRGNTYIDYEQLGLKFKLYSCEVLFNRGLCYMYLKQEKPGMQDFSFAIQEKMTPDHDVIDDAIRERAVGYTVFSIPVGVLYRPNEAKVKNLKTKDYLGKARLIATATANTSTGFSGAEEKQQQVFASAARDDRLPENISYAATNLVDRTLTSRRGAREQSAPPTMRNMFPPTPPPEAEKPARTNSGTPSNLHYRTSSMSSSNTRSNRFPAQPSPQTQETRPNIAPRSQTYGPPSLDLSRSTPLHTPDSSKGYQRSSGEAPRIGTVRTASEPRGPASRRMFHERNSSSRAPPPAPLFRETTPQEIQEPVQSGNSVDDVYNMYAKAAPKSRQSRRTIEQQQYLDEEDEYINESPDDNSLNESPPNGYAQPGNARISGIASPQAARRSEMRKIRIKVHTKEDTRYVLVNQSSLRYNEFEHKIREKFGMQGRLKIKMRDLDDDQGHMITMADQDDLDVLLGYVKDVARRERNEMGKMEVWLQEV